MTGTMAMLGVCVATTEPTVEQVGQICDADGGAVRSAQKWNCAARKTNPRSKAQRLIRCVLPSIVLPIASLGRNGCGVKEASSGMFTGWTRVPRIFIGVLGLVAR